MKKFINRGFRGLFCLLALLSGQSCSNDASPFEVSSATVRTLLPGRTTTVAFATLSNHTDKSITLVSAVADKVRKIEFHTHIREGDLVKMRRLPNLLIPANDSIVLATGAKHLMLFGVDELTEQLDIQFTSESGKVYSTTFTIIEL